MLQMLSVEDQNLSQTTINHKLFSFLREKFAFTSISYFVFLIIIKFLFVER